MARCNLNSVNNCRHITTWQYITYDEFTSNTQHYNIIIPGANTFGVGIYYVTEYKVSPKN